MKQQRGFTLIELIIVIVILGILAVTAAPRFIDIQSDAKAGVLEGVKSALQSSSQLVYAKSAIAGVQRLAGDASGASVTINGVEVPVAFGYPDAEDFSAIDGANGITAFVDVQATDFQLVQLTGAPASFRIFFSGEPTSDNDCYVEYLNAPGQNAVPTIRVLADDC